MSVTTRPTRAYGQGLKKTSVRVHPSTWAAFAEWCKARGVTANEGLRQLMDDAVKEAAA